METEFAGQDTAESWWTGRQDRGSGTAATSAAVTTSSGSRSPATNPMVRSTSASQRRFDGETGAALRRWTARPPTSEDLRSRGPPPLPQRQLLLARYNADFGWTAPSGTRLGGDQPATDGIRRGRPAGREDPGRRNGLHPSALPNGRLDPSFGRRGIVSLGNQSSTALALQAGQKILVGEAHGDAWTLARLLGGNNCIVPKLRGKTLSKARKTLKASYCRTGRISSLFSTKVAWGQVISTATPPGDRLPDGTKVDLAVSRAGTPNDGRARTSGVIPGGARSKRAST